MCLLRNAAFFVVETAWVLAWEKVVEGGCPMPGVPWQTRMHQKDDDDCPNKIW